MIFRLFEDSDLAQYLAWTNDREIWRVDNAGAYEFRTAQSFSEQWRRIIGWARSWIIEVDGVPIGYIGFVSTDDDELTDEFFIVIGEVEEWGKGYGKRAMKWLFRTGLELGLSKVTGQVLGNNERALRFYEALGFSVVGRGKPRFERDGSTYDTLRIERSLTASDA